MSVAELHQSPKLFLIQQLGLMSVTFLGKPGSGTTTGAATN